jgi:hypothetical protein
MRRPQSRPITLVELAQFVPLVLFPWPLRASTLAFIAVIALLSAMLGWMLYQRRPSGITLTIFVQGMNIVVRVITFFPNVYGEANGFDVAFFVTYVVSIVLSFVVLGAIDRPEVRLRFESSQEA